MFWLYLDQNPADHILEPGMINLKPNYIRSKRGFGGYLFGLLKYKISIQFKSEEKKVWVVQKKKRRFDDWKRTCGLTKK